MANHSRHLARHQVSTLVLLIRALLEARPLLASRASLAALLEARLEHRLHVGFSAVLLALRALAALLEALLQLLLGGGLGRRYELARLAAHLDFAQASLVMRHLLKHVWKQQPFRHS